MQSNSQRVAFVICRDVALVKSIISFAERDERASQWVDDPAKPENKQYLRKVVSYVLSEVQITRKVLERTHLKGKEGILVKPSAWQRDLNGNGRVEGWEKYFFAIPKRKSDAIKFKLPSDDEDYYHNEYNLDAVISVDQSDIAWSLSYHYFVESLIETILAYTYTRDENGPHLELYDRKAMVRAHELILKGLSTSNELRDLIQSERSDFDEWIPSPKQMNSSFPVALDAEDLQVWKALLDHVTRLFKGQTILVSQYGDGMSGLFGYISRMCPKGNGLNLANFYLNPPRVINKFDSDLAYLCTAPDLDHPPSELNRFVEKYGRRITREDTGGADAVKYLLWVN